MIDLPTRPIPNALVETLIDRGFVMRGASSLRVDRPGSRYNLAFSYPPLTPEQRDTFLGPLKRAKRQGIRIYIPMLVKQGIPGSPVTDGAVTSMLTALPVRGLTPGYVARVNFWLTLIDADGNTYLHSMAETVIADDAGNAVLQIEPPCRAPLLDGATIELGRPYITGFITDENFTHSTPAERYSDLTITVEEYR